jgi:hypothetical protein
MLRPKGTLNPDGSARKPRGGFFVQGLLVALSNPKTLAFLAPSSRNSSPRRAITVCRSLSWASLRCSLQPLRIDLRACRRPRWAPAVSQPHQADAAAAASWSAAGCGWPFPRRSDPQPAVQTVAPSPQLLPFVNVDPRAAFGKPNQAPSRLKMVENRSSASGT